MRIVNGRNTQDRYDVLGKNSPAHKRTGASINKTRLPKEPIERQRDYTTTVLRIDPCCFCRKHRHQR